MANRGRKPQANKINITSITCLACGETKKVSEFYLSSSVFNAGTGRVQYCKSCCISMSCENNGDISINKLKNVLEKIDKPFLKDVLQSAYEQSNNTPEGIKKIHPLSLYFKNINSLGQYKNLTWIDSVFEPSIQVDNNEVESNKSINETNKISASELRSLQEKFGYGYEPEEYLNFERKYKKLSRGYKEKTELHTERLMTYITHKVKEEMATAKGQVAEAEKWARLAQADATAAKLNVSQLSKSDITGGIDLIPQLVEAVEQYVSVIPLLPKVLAQPYDDADLIIWANVNYLRHLEDKPFVSYSDIWKFYDMMLEEHFKQKGYSNDKILEEKKKRNNIFRDLGSVYVEPLYENPDEFVEDGEE